MTPRRGGPHRHRAQQQSRAGAAAGPPLLIWVGAAAEGRALFPELHLIAYWAQLTDRPAEVAAERIARQGLAITPAELLASPHCLIGPRAALTELLHELRERRGFSDVTLYDQDAKALEPLVAELTGR